MFWKTVKRPLLDKVTSIEKIILICNDKIIENYDGTAKVFHTFFSSIVSEFKIANRLQ